LRNAGKRANLHRLPKICPFAQIEHLSKINQAKSRKAGKNKKTKAPEGGK
jgi:hypothetical protein